LLAKLQLISNYANYECNAKLKLESNHRYLLLDIGPTFGTVRYGTVRYAVPDFR